MNFITKEELRLVIQHVCTVIIENEKELTRIDTVIGDGDHGIGMKRGFSAVKEMLIRNPDLKPYDLLHQTGIELVKTMGGASGVLFGSLFTGGSKAINRDTEMLTMDDMSNFFLNGTQTIFQRGKAALGEKTMLDALVPAVKAFEVAVTQGDDKKTCFEKAWKASLNGATDTIHMISKKGRSKNFHELTIGLPDPGAVSVSLLFQGFSEFFQ